MNIKLKLSFILMILYCQGLMYGQCPTYVAGFNCEDAPVICDLTCLNGFVGQMLDTNSAIIKLNIAKQPIKPNPICNTGGDAQNMSWFAFIAGSTSASITITPSNCRYSNGIQAGMFGDCNFLDNINGSGPVNEEFLDCQNTGSLSPITLMSDKLKKGQTYYFYVDGNQGDVCSYRVTINNAVQASSLPQMKSYDQGLDSMVACLDDEIQLSNSSLGLEIEYHWSIDTLNVTSQKKFTRTFSNLRKFKFDKKGSYRISMFATNGCTYTDTLSKLIVIKEKGIENFPELSVCENKLPIPGPKNIDPNNDGIIGWIGPDLIAGANMFRIQYSPSCYIDQKITVNSIPSVAPIRIKLEGCDSVVFRGEVFNGDFSDWPIMAKSNDPNGCDTLYEISTTVYRIEGQITASSCKDGKVEIKFTESSSSLQPTSVVKYIWTDGNNKVLSENNGLKTIQIDYKTKVQLKIWIINGNDSCQFVIAPLDVDPLSTKPSKPVPINWDDTYCENEGAKQFLVAPITDSIKWSLSAGTLVFNKNIASVTLTSANSQAILCAETRNSCGVEMVCDTIQFFKKTAPKLLPQYFICQDSSLNLKPLDSGINPRWKSKGEIQYLLEGNIRINYKNSGIDTLTIVDTFAGCSYYDTAYVRVVPTITTPNPTYIATSQTLTINWPVIPCTKFYRISLDDKILDTTSKSTFLISQLATNKEYLVKVEAISDPITNCNCSSSSTTIVARTGGCNYLTFEVKTPVNSVCEDGWKQRMQLSHLKQGNKQDNKVVWSGTGVDAAGFFIPETAGVGIAKIIGKYEELGCTFIDTAFIDVFTNPMLKLDITQPECQDEVFGGIVIHTKDGRSLKHMYLDNKEIQDSVIANLSQGTYEVVVYDQNLCKKTEIVKINPPTIPTLNLGVKDTNLFSGSKLLLNPKANVSIDSITWKVNNSLVCDKCNSYTYLADDKGLFEIDINYTYGKCMESESITIDVTPVTKLYLPNILQVSSQDDKNSKLKIIASVPNIKILSFSIYSRWGEIVLQQQNFMLEEDAMHVIDLSQSNIQSGVYIINVSYQDPITGASKTEIKDITILK